LDIAIASHPRSRVIGIQIVIPILIITITTTIQYVLPIATITTTTRGTFSSAHPSRGATPCHDHNPATAGQYHAPSVTREQSRGCKTSSLQWKNGRGEHIH